MEPGKVYRKSKKNTPQKRKKVSTTERPCQPKVKNHLPDPNQAGHPGFKATAWERRSKKWWCQIQNTKTKGPQKTPTKPAPPGGKGGVLTPQLKRPNKGV